MPARFIPQYCANLKLYYYKLARFQRKSMQYLHNKAK